MLPFPGRISPWGPIVPSTAGDRTRPQKAAGALRIGLIAPPLLPLPPIGYAGTERVVAALAIGLLAANEVWQFLPEGTVNGIFYLAGAAGLYFLRDAVERLKQKLPTEPTKP